MQRMAGHDFAHAKAHVTLLEEPRHLARLDVYIDSAERRI